MSIENPDEVPTPWRTYFTKRGIEPTFRALHRKVEDSMSLNTVIRALTGEGTSTKRVATRLAEELGISLEKFQGIRSELTGDVRGVPFDLPARADQLDPAERAAVVGVINAILNARDKSNAVPTDQTAQSDAPETGNEGEEDDDDGDRPRSPDKPKPAPPGTAADPIGDEIITSANPEINDRDHGT